MSTVSVLSQHWYCNLITLYREPSPRLPVFLCLQCVKRRRFAYQVSPAGNPHQSAAACHVAPVSPHIQPPHTVIWFCQIVNRLHNHRVHVVGTDIFNSSHLFNDIRLKASESFVVGIAGTKIINRDTEPTIPQLLKVLMLLPEFEGLLP